MAYGSKHFHWEENKLFFGKQDTKHEVVPFMVEGKQLWKIKFPDQILSDDFYNLDRAKDNCLGWVLKRTNDPEQKT